MIIALIRTILLYLLIIAGIRLMGKRQIGELEPSELVLALLIADLAAVPMQDFGIPMIAGVVPILALLCMAMIISVLNMRFSKFRYLLCGSPSILIENGALQQKEMGRNRFTINELMEELRIQGVTDLSTVKYAILEPNGRVSVLLYANEKPATAAQVNAIAEESGLPLVVINDGRLIPRNLKIRGLDENWLMKQLKPHGIGDCRDVFLLTVDEQNRVYFAAKALDNAKAGVVK